MKRYGILLLVMLILTVLFSCSLKIPEQSELSTWNINISVPLIETSVTLNELITDSLIEKIPVDDSGDSIFIFRDTLAIDSTLVGDQLELDPISESFVQSISEVSVDSTNKHFSTVYDTVGIDDIQETINAEIGLIELSNIEPDTTQPFLFREIMPDSIVQAIEDEINNQGGQTNAIIDTTDLVPQTKSFSFSTFRNAFIEEGTLQIKVINEMFIALGAPVTVALKDSQNNVIDNVVFDEEIPSGATSTRILDLAGKHLPGTLNVEVFGTSNGTHGEVVQVTTASLDSYFRIVIAPENIKVTEAEAQVPSQTITDTSEIFLQESDTKVHTARLMTARMNIDLTNLMQVTGTLFLNIPSLRSQNDEPYTLTISLPVGNQQYSEDLSGWSMVMPLESQKINYDYRIITDDTEPDFILINQSDRVDIDLQIVDVTFDQINGIIKQQTVEDSGAIDISSRSVIQSALISEGELNIQIDNKIGGEADVRLQIDELISDGLPLTRDIHIFPGLNNETILLNGYSVQPDINEQKLNYHTTTVTAADLQADYNLRDSINVLIKVSELTFSEVSGFIHQDAVVKSDAIELNNETKVQSARFKSGIMRLVIANYIGTVADVNFTVDEIVKDGQSLSKTIPIFASPNPETTYIDIGGYEIQLPLNDQQIHYSSTVNLDSTVLMNLSLEDSIRIDVDLYDLSFESVTGIISPVEVDIDTIKKDITALPDELNGVEFDDVDILIDFDTNIGVPVFLTLNIIARNAGGDFVSSGVSNWNITDSNLVKIPHAETLINIKPDQILAYGTATVGAEDAVGSVATDQYVAGQMYVSAPLYLTFTGDAVIDLDPQIAEAPIPEEVKTIKLWVQSENQFEFGAKVHVLVAEDTLAFLEDSNIEPDTLLTLLLKAQSNELDSILLDEHLTSLLQDTVYLKPLTQLLGNENGSPSRFISTDSLTVQLYGKFKYYLDFTASDEKGEGGDQ